MLGYEEWRARLRKCCGHYYSEPTKDRAASERFDVVEAQGLDVASIRCTIDRMERTQQGIRRDDAEHFFLLHQIDGEMGINHCGRDALLAPGDFLLLDSTRPAELIFDGHTAEFQSVHIPRSLFLAGRKHAPATGNKVTARHPLHASLKNLIADESDRYELDSFQTDDFFDFVAMVFGPDPEQVTIGQFRNQGGRMRYVSQIIDQNLRDPDFSIDDLAKCVGRSRRQLQRDLSQSGTNFTHLLQSRRLHHFIAAGRRSDRHGHRISIAELAQFSGFSDQSHFNRVFRNQFEKAPSEMLRRSQ